jgi:hypothetical protein
VCASSNGLNFALYKSRTDQVTIIRFDEQNCYLLKTFNVEGAITKFLKSNQDESLREMKANTHWLKKNGRTGLEYTIKINNKADILIRINKKFYEEKEDLETIYLF